VSEVDKQIADALAKTKYDPLLFVNFAYPWETDNTSLSDFTGPDTWQAKLLHHIGTELKDSKSAVRVAVRSGHSIGKTAFLSWIIHWWLSTRVNAQAVVTANTKVQLEDKTWRELAKWHGLSWHQHWFKHTATKFYHVQNPALWYAINIPWSKEKSEAFAGKHEKYVLVVYDEASAIDDVIWEVTEGAMSNPKGEALWLAFGNPTRNTGRFSRCFKQDSIEKGGRWITYEIDARSAQVSNKDEIEAWIKAYGADSDFVRVRVLGKEPRSGFSNLIGESAVEQSAGKHIPRAQYEHAARVIGVDVARFGDDKTVIIKRQGRAAFDLEKFRGLDTVGVARAVIRVMEDFEPDAVFIDEGYNPGVIDYIRDTGRDVTGVQFGSKAQETDRFVNKRTEMWWLLKEWLESGGAIPDDRELKDDLVAPEYGFDNAGRIMLEKKDDMKKKGLPSPDCGDALAITFAEPVVGKAFRLAGMGRQNFSKTDYDVLEYAQ